VIQTVLHSPEICASENGLLVRTGYSRHDVGTLYVLANRDNSLAKIGLTRSGKPDTRADDYSRAHSIQWHVYWFADTRNVAEAERRT
jgi:hypothetical protein